MRRRRRSGACRDRLRDRCADITVPGGPSCARRIADLDDLGSCIDCTIAAVTACLDARAVPALRAYPAECANAVPSASPTSSGPSIIPSVTPSSTASSSPTPSASGTPSGTPSASPTPRLVDGDDHRDIVGEPERHVDRDPIGHPELDRIVDGIVDPDTIRHEQPDADGEPDIGMVPLTGTTNAQHMAEDLRVDRFTLTPDEVGRIETIGI